MPRPASPAMPHFSHMGPRMLPQLVPLIISSALPLRSTMSPRGLIRTPISSVGPSAIDARSMWAARCRSSVDPGCSASPSSMLAKSLPSIHVSPKRSPSSTESRTARRTAIAINPSFIVSPCQASMTLSMPSADASGRALPSGQPFGAHFASMVRIDGRNGGSIDNAR